jgi:hypothetical protein
MQGRSGGIHLILGRLAKKVVCEDEANEVSQNLSGRAKHNQHL